MSVSMNDRDIYCSNKNPFSPLLLVIVLGTGSTSWHACSFYGSFHHTIQWTAICVKPVGICTSEIGDVVKVFNREIEGW